MGLSATLDGILTITLIRCLWRSRSPSMYRTNDLIRQLITLTLETVLLTHLCGAIMCVLFLTQPAQHRTKTTAFWIFLEVITELYSLSVVFTINARSSARRTFHGSPSPPITPPQPIHQEPNDPPSARVVTNNFADQRRLDFAVEGLQEIPRFTYHFPASTDPGHHAAGKVGNRGKDDLLELSVLPFTDDLEGATVGLNKESVESESSTIMKSEDHTVQGERKDKSLSFWNKRL
ncbi:hypothetical protein QFC19_008022 [Naganishia cerealis]|uniref:Uncharacterized protein n=1 Tax=Naganishia cerealis TaxID=610337 RepID=A0ACC2V6H6_9TREE|nr:hypothetical protein QFC19_008022 [Naganishia cerealis]